MRDKLIFKISKFLKFIGSFSGSSRIQKDRERLNRTDVVIKEYSNHVYLLQFSEVFQSRHLDPYGSSVRYEDFVKS